MSDIESILLIPKAHRWWCGNLEGLSHERGWVKLGCTRNNHIFFGSNRNEPKLNLFRLFFSLLLETKLFFQFVSVCFGVLNRYRNNRNKPNQIKIISKKQISIRVSSKQLHFFRFAPKQTETQPVLIVFRFVFSRNPTKFWLVCFGVLDWYRNNQNKQNLWCGELKRFIF
jgi:hypothetical protein